MVRLAPRIKIITLLYSLRLLTSNYCRFQKFRPSTPKAIPHNSKCRYGERGAAAAKPKAQIILDAAKVSAASGGNSEPKQHPVLSALLAWHLPHLARRIGT